MENGYKRFLPYAAIAVAVFVVAIVASEMLVNANYSVSATIVSVNASKVVFPYQSSWFNITIKNTGGAPISGMTVGLYLDGSELQHYTVSLPGHRNISIPYNYTHRQSGSFSFSVVADPGRLLNIADRNTTQSAVVVNVIAPELPNVYRSVPNSNVVGTQSFGASGTGMYSLSAVKQAYYLKLIDNLFGPSKDMLVKVVDNLYGYIAKSYVANLQYENGTSSYVMWLGGTATPGLVDYVISTFRVPQSSAVVNGANVVISQTGNGTSICTVYSNGWTKIVAYDNNNLGGNCLGIMNKNYEPTQSSMVVNALNGSKELSHYQSGFLYANSVSLGSSVISSDKGVGVLNLFQNNYGLFISEVFKTKIPNNAVSQKCYGIIYTDNGVRVCSSIVVPTNRTAAAGFGLVNSTEITKDYVISMYSLVNNTQFLAAHRNAAALINALGVNESGIVWTTIYNNSCAFGSGDGLSCSVNGFDFNTEVANVSIKNNRAAPVRINSALCQIPNYNMSQSINVTIGSGSTNAISFPCHGISAIMHSQTTSYKLVLNYTYNNANTLANGLLNVSSAGFD